MVPDSYGVSLVATLFIGTLGKSFTFDNVGDLKKLTSLHTTIDGIARNIVHVNNPHISI